MILNQMKYGNPSQDVRDDLITIEEYGFDIAATPLLIAPHPKNDSAETKEELAYLLELQSEERPFMERLIASADKDLLGIFLDMCAEWQLAPHEEEAKKILKNWGLIATAMKAYFNRARPFQIAPYHKTPLFPMTSVSAWSSSYPSGHTIQAEGLALFYGTKYPELDQEFEDVAKAISHTRLVGGFHFPSDILAGEKLVKDLSSVFGVFYKKDC